MTDLGSPVGPEVEGEGDLHLRGIGNVRAEIDQHNLKSTKCCVRTVLLRAASAINISAK